MWKKASPSNPFPPTSSSGTKKNLFLAGATKTTQTNKRWSVLLHSHKKSWLANSEATGACSGKGSRKGWGSGLMRERHDHDKCPPPYPQNPSGILYDQQRRGLRVGTLKCTPGTSTPPETKSKWFAILYTHTSRRHSLLYTCRTAADVSNVRTFRRTLRHEALPCILTDDSGCPL